MKLYYSSGVFEAKIRGISLQNIYRYDLLFPGQSFTAFIEL